MKPLVPSDFFFVVSRCADVGRAGCSSGPPKEVLAFVFPNTDFGDNCLMVCFFSTILFNNPVIFASGMIFSAAGRFYRIFIL